MGVFMAVMHYIRTHGAPESFHEYTKRKWAGA